ncbi:PQQ-binding-like beta-propeller repeat protein [Candidatus Poribacteria bacterium]|nr:PQQ-binding-like beta-propeller repeat protein [Candidatus Poribacteria bacterium]
MLYSVVKCIIYVSGLFNTQSGEDNMSKTFTRIAIICVFLTFFAIGLANAEGWLTYRYDSARSGFTSEKMAAPLSLKWNFVPNHTPKPAWPMPGEEQPRMHFDSVYHTVVSDGKVYFGSSVDGKIYALDSDKGEVEWTFFTDGPIRFAPSIYDDKIYFGSDDGYVYCLEAKNGKMVWKYRAGPSDEKIIGNGRMISLWPVRTSVLVEDGVVYFGAGVYPYEGVYICALDAENGDVIWKNDTLGDRAHEMTYGGISPQSFLVASENVLYVPSGRAMPAAFNKKTGQFLRYLPAGHTGGTWALVADGELVAGVDASGRPAKIAFDAETGQRKGDLYAWFPGLDMVIAGDISYTVTKDGVKAISRSAYPHLNEKLNTLREDQKKLNAMLTDLKSKLADVDERMRIEINRQIEEGAAKIEALTREEEVNIKNLACKWQYDRKDLYSIILAGDTVIAGGKDVVVAINAKDGKEIWNANVDGRAYGLSSADGKLFVSTHKGNIYSFGEKSDSPGEVVKVEIDNSPYTSHRNSSNYAEAAKNILNNTGVKKGYCLILDADNGRLAYEIARQSELKVVGIEKDKKKTAKAKEMLDKAGLYGSQVIVENWNISSLPPYFANLVVSDSMMNSGDTDYNAGDVFRVLRPYGGIAYLGHPDSNKVEDKINDWVANSEMPKPEIINNGGQWAKMVRGELEGAGDWTEQYADPQNTACSKDELVRSPLGILWFGEPGSEKIMDRHAKGEAPVGINGLLFIQGEEVIMGVDSYNGTILWEREIPGAVRPRTDVDTGNLSLTEDALYLAAYEKCYCLDPETGETKAIFEVPPTEDGSPRRWAYIASYDGLLYGSRGMPLSRDYFTFWEDGEWVDPEEVPAEYLNEYNQMKAAYPDAEGEMWEALKRSGQLWRRLANYPSWEIYNPSKGAVTSRTMVSDMVFAMNPNTGEIVWKHEGEKIAGITISIGGGKVFFAESSITENQKDKAFEDRKKLTQEGIYEESPVDAEFADLDVRTACCLDAATGKEIWKKDYDFTWCGGDALATAYHDDGILLYFANMGSHDAWRHKNLSLIWKRMTALSAEDGSMIWSKPNNYRTRPFIIGDDVYIEPRVCDVHTGEIKMRKHPITGEEVPWEYLRPGHTCAISSAAANMAFTRSYCGAFFDIENDAGVTLFGGTRPGCWINMVPANGVLLFPEASAGCTCSFPVRASLVMVTKPDRIQPYNVFITHGKLDTVRHFAINLGAPGDMRDSEGNLWFAYPNPNTRYGGNHYPDYGVKFNLNEKTLEGMGFFSYDARTAQLPGTSTPWLYASGCLGLLKSEISLVDKVWGDEPGTYTVQLGFAAPSEDKTNQRVFDIKLQGDVVLGGFDIVKEAGGSDKPVVKEFKGIKVEDKLLLELIPENDNPTFAHAPIINFIKAVREDTPSIPDMASVKAISETEAKEMLKKANADMKNGNHSQALEAYHTVFDAAPSAELKVKAVEGIATIASPESLSTIAAYCKGVDPVVIDYKLPGQEVKDGIIKACVAIANNVAKEDKERAVAMLNQAMITAGESEVREEVVNSLQELGVDVKTE